MGSSCGGKSLIVQIWRGCYFRSKIKFNVPRCIYTYDTRTQSKGHVYELHERYITLLTIYKF